jgi:hypothetical protein
MINMTKTKTVYDKLLPDVKKQLQANARKYGSAKRLKYTLMSKTMWNELTIEDMKDLLTFGDVTSYKLDWQGFMYGENIISK